MRAILIGSMVCLLLIGEKSVSDSYYGGDSQIKSSCHTTELLFESEWLLDSYDNEFEYYLNYGKQFSAGWQETILSGKLYYTATKAYCAKVNGGACSSTEAQLAADRLCNNGEASDLQDCVGHLKQSYHDRDYRSLSLTVSGEGAFHNPNNVYGGDRYIVQAELVLADGCKLSWKDEIGFYRCDDLDEDGHPEFSLCCDDFGPEDGMCWGNGDDSF